MDIRQAADRGYFPADKGANHEVERNIRSKIAEKLSHNYGRTLEDASEFQLYNAVALTVRDAIMEKWTASREAVKQSKPKHLYYLSLEFLIGRALNNNIMNLLKTDAYCTVLSSLGLTAEGIAGHEHDAGLGNGGLGRLAACFMESLSTLNMSAAGCGIYYEYGLFQQRIIDGNQVEYPDLWLEDGNIWEVKNPDELYEVHFGGQIAEEWYDGAMRFAHSNFESVIAVPHDIPVLGYGSDMVNMLRLWSARSPKHIDMGLFNKGEYHSASREKDLAEALSKVLYPEDNHYTGKTLRLRQQYFFVSATVQWIVREYKRIHGTNFIQMADHISIHINDTHPALAIPELMRILIDVEKLNWTNAWEIVCKVFAYTNHTVLAEALERWPVAFFQQNLPRIYNILVEINETYCKSLWNVYPGQWERIADMAVIADGEVKMANLCVVMCEYVNGVSGLHTEILKSTVFGNYYLYKPDKFLNVTNGVTHRRWLLQANPGLSDLISETIGTGWVMEPEALSGLSRYADDAAFAEKFAAIKRYNKVRLAEYIAQADGIRADPDSIFDVQIKRLHEYKRQLLNVIHILYLYRRLKEDRAAAECPRTFIFGAKASPGYHRAKMIIKLIHSVAEYIANDPDPFIQEMIRVVFIQNYGVSIAEKIIPAADVSEQISTAGKEASGTGNMKLMINGAVTLGTLDGANVEIRNLVGDDNIFIFGLSATQANELLSEGYYDSRRIYDADEGLARAVDMLADGSLQPDKPRLFVDIYNSLLWDDAETADRYLVFPDFNSYEEAQRNVDARYKQIGNWRAMAIRNVAAAGYFSSDRAIREYNRRIWKLA